MKRYEMENYHFCHVLHAHLVGTQFSVTAGKWAFEYTDVTSKIDKRGRKLVGSDNSIDKKVNRFICCDSAADVLKNILKMRSS
jgi:hypothetical protein